MILRAGETTTSRDDPISQYAARLCRLRAPAARIRAIALKSAEISSQAHSSATRAQDRLDNSEDDLQSAALLGLALSRMPDAGWSKSHPKVSQILREYQSRANAARRNRGKP